MATFDLGKFGISLEGDYSDETTYEKLSQVRYDGASWLSIKQTTGNTPSENSEYWQKVVNDGPDAPSTIRNKTNITLDTSGWINHEYDLSDDLETLSDENINILDIELDGDTATAVQSQEYKDSVLFPKTDAKKIFSVVTPSQDIPIVLTYNNVIVRDEVDFDVEEILSTLEPKPWNSASNEDLVKYIKLIDTDYISSDDVYAVGDQRIIPLSGLDDNACFVIMHKNDFYTYADGRTVHYIAGMKHCLPGTRQAHSSSSYSWSYSTLRSFCNGAFYNAVPESIREIFKQFNTDNVIDYFATPTETDLGRFNWYTLSWNNRKKYNGGGSGANPGGDGVLWWLRNADSNGACRTVQANGNVTGWNATRSYGVSPFGCI